MYTIVYSSQAQEDFRKLKKDEPAAIENTVHVDVLSAYGHYDDK